MAAIRKLLSVHHILRNGDLLAATQQRSVKRWVAPTLRELKKRKDRLGPEPIQKRSSFLEWNYHAEIFAFGKRLKEDFDRTLLQQAFTTRSYIVQEEMKQEQLGIEDPKLALTDNQELGKEGMKFMKNYIEIYLRESLPKLPEEGVVAICKFLMADSMLASISKLIGTEDLILSAEFPVEESTLVQVFCAVVGALLKSSGSEKTGLFVRDFVVAQLAGRDVSDIWSPEQPLLTLENILEQQGRAAPEPRLIGVAGPNTILAAYRVAVYSDRQFLGAGFGESVDTAVEQAALDALKRLFSVTENMKPFSYKINPDVEMYKANSNASLEDWGVKHPQNIVNC
ncbi:39S ribosomal protein L44, mitochondrial [Schistocerca gregaria]|uniref:39S ribosomal protein L44, mitochondrial n=1 Tax=Schistocerca gregaria TaxID=7010 RepID=UPI00211E3FC8|nr:39S ribosomal protein L44, mitochondrial [Schistocerca gregaria]